MTLSETEFVRAMNNLRGLQMDIDGVDAALRKLDPDFGGFHVARLTELVFDILKDAMKDNDDWIPYFVYELDWGSKYEPGSITEADGKVIPLGTLSDLYDLLVETP